MSIFKKRVLTDSVQIDAPVQKIWEFFDNIEVNYKSWHEDSHVTCKWLKGRPHEEGSLAYFEEILDGKLCKIKVITTKVEKHKLVETKPPFPVSFIHTRGTYKFESKGNSSIFTAINHFRIPPLFNKNLLSLIDATEEHMKEEGENLKRIIENNG
ncbi:MAG: SRPBCC family protein [Proteobacteria bacterium]|nr:SRPBCC family protein [bacterium]MBU4011153.1 SRPBCC family protein [Pseudomonadota bacterium]